MGDWIEVKYKPERNGYNVKVKKHSCKTCECKPLDIGEKTKIWEEIKDVPIDDFSLDRWFNYWMDETDPRGSKRLSLEHWQLDMGGDY
jgi:hypothetical protein